MNILIIQVFIIFSSILIKLTQSGEVLCDRNCPQNEVYSKCVLGIYQPTCWNRNITATTTVCSLGCVCAPGMIRDPNTYECIPIDSCPPSPNNKTICALNEIYSTCARCQRNCLNMNGFYLCACAPACTCKSGYVRNAINGKCITTSECSACPPNYERNPLNKACQLKCQECPENEEYRDCGPGCEENCFSRTTDCDESCKRGCFCKAGYVRSHTNGTCIPKETCPIIIFGRMSFENISTLKAQRLLKYSEGAKIESNEGHELELSKIIVNVETPQTLSNVLDKRDQITLDEFSAQKFDNIHQALEFFDSLALSKSFNDDENVTLFKFEILDHFPELSSTELNELSNKCIKKSIVILFASQNDEKFSIYWKSNRIDQLLTFKSYDSDFMRSNRKLFEFIANFLIKSLKNNHLGIRKLDSKHESTEFELHYLADHREYNILLVGAEMGNFEVVEILLKLNISTDSTFKSINAQTLAYNNQHFDLLLLLLKNNLTFPAVMDVNKCSIEVQGFVNISRKFHEHIKANEIANVLEIIQQNPIMIYFYNEYNESAVSVALKNNRPQIYEVLLINDFKFGPHEKIEVIMEELEYKTQRAVREIHVRNTKEMSESHLNVLMANSSVSHDALNPKEMTSHVNNAFNILNAIPLIRVILMVVAASKKFKIIFDFNRDTVQVIDPTSGAYNNGIFYLTGRIFIGAKQLLDEATRNLVLATIAHELCHYAISLTFSNDARPYHSNDNKSMQEFERISSYCKENHGDEDVIRLVYDCYPNDMHHAELAVRVAHLMALYHGQPEKLQESRDDFLGLFRFVEEKVAPEMTKAIPDVESKFDKEIEKKDKKISKLRKSLYAAIIFGIITAAFVGFYFYNPIYKFSELSEKQQMKIRDGHVLYKNVEIKLSDLFSGNFNVFNNLTSDHISNLLDNEILNFDDPLLHYLDKEIIFYWGNMADKLKLRVLDSNLNFQGRIVKFMDINNLYLDILLSLTSEQIRMILNGTEIEIGQKIKSQVDFYYERKFIPEDTGIIWFEYAFGYEYISDYFTANNDFINRTGNKTFQEFVEEFFRKSFDDRLEILNKVRENHDFRASHFELSDETFSFMCKNLTEIIKQVILMIL